jgi:hypothetical protein
MREVIISYFKNQEYVEEIMKFPTNRKSEVGLLIEQQVNWLENVEVLSIEINQEMLSNRFKIKLKSNQGDIAFTVGKVFWDENAEIIINQDIVERTGTNIYNFPMQLLRGSNEENILYLSTHQISRLCSKIKELSNEIYLFVGKIRETVPEIQKSDLRKLEFVNSQIALSELDLENPSKHLEPDKEIAVFVHGLGSDVSNNFKGLYEQLCNDFNILAFIYPTIHPTIESNGEIFKDLLAKLNKRTSKKIHIFAHSMGGLVTRSAIRKSAPISTVTMAGTPNNGADISRVAVLLNWFQYKATILSQKDILELFRYQVPQGLKDLQPGEYIENLNNDEKNQHLYYLLLGRILKFSHDGIVSVNSMKKVINSNALHELSCFHTNYYKEKNKVDTAIKKALNYHGLKLKVTV